MWLLQPQVVLSAALLAVAVAMWLRGRSLAREDARLESVLYVLGFALLIWLPQLWLDAAVSLLLAIFSLFLSESVLLKLIWAGSLGGGCFALARVIRGGAAVMLLAVAVFAIAVITPGVVRHLRRLARARRLDPRSAAGEVEIGGKAVGDVPPPGGLEGPLAAWCTLDPARGVVARPALLPLQTEIGTVLVDLATAQLDLSPTRTKVLRGAEAVAIRGAPTRTRGDAEESAGSGADAEAATATQPATGAAEGGEAEPTCLVGGLEPGCEVHVTGVPVWEPDPTGAYRPAGPVPVFRGSEAQPVKLIDRSEDEERARTRWKVARLIGWGLVCVAVGVLRLFLAR